jgi:hypothetical protein
MDGADLLTPYAAGLRYDDDTVHAVERETASRWATAAVQWARERRPRQRLSVVQDDCACNRDAARAGTRRACERSGHREGARELHRPLPRPNDRLRRKDSGAQAWAADRNVQAERPRSGASHDQRQREARSRARGDEHLASARGASGPLTGREATVAAVSGRRPRRSVVPNRRGAAWPQARQSPTPRPALGRPRPWAGVPSRATDRRPGCRRRRACAAR